MSLVQAPDRETHGQAAHHRLDRAGQHACPRRLPRAARLDCVRLTCAKSTWRRQDLNVLRMHCWCGGRAVSSGSRTLRIHQRSHPRLVNHVPTRNYILARRSSDAHPYPMVVRGLSSVTRASRRSGSCKKRLSCPPPLPDVAVAASLVARRQSGLFYAMLEAQRNSPRSAV